MGVVSDTHASTRHRVLRIVISALATVALIVGASFAGLWWAQWRTINVVVNGQAFETLVQSSLHSFLQTHKNFGHTAGRLLSVSGKVLDEQGGKPASFSLNNKPITKSQLRKTLLNESDHVQIANGTDSTEKYSEITQVIPHGVSVQLGTGSVQYVAQAGSDGSKVVWKGEISGESVVHSESSPVDSVVTSRNPQPQDGNKYVALTFDDGPSPYTSAILDILATKGVKVTFFNVGTGAAAYPDLERRIVSEGHQLANHTQDHAELTKQSVSKIQWEIDTAAQKITANTGTTTSLGMFRAPYGSFTASTWQSSFGHISSNILWSVDTRDWTRPGADAITRSVFAGASNGGIILMHDGGGDRSQDVAALPGIIDGLRSRGFKLVTMTELLRLDGNFPDYVINGTLPSAE